MLLLLLRPLLLRVYRLLVLLLIELLRECEGVLSRPCRLHEVGLLLLLLLLLQEAATAEDGDRR